MTWDDPFNCYRCGLPVEVTALQRERLLLAWRPGRVVHGDCYPPVRGPRTHP